MADKKAPPPKAARGTRSLPVDLSTEAASRLRDPFEALYMGVLRTNDPLLLERGAAGSQAHQLYRDLMRDGKVFSGLQKRTLAIQSKPWSVAPVKDTPKGKADAEMVSDILKRVNFDQLCGALLRALITGWQPAEIVWTVREGLVVPARIPARAHRRFVYVQDEESQPPQLRLLTRHDMLRGEPLPDRKFIVHRLNAEDDNPYGTGLGLQLYWPVYFKRMGIVAWNKLNDRFGAPTPWGKHRPGADKKERGTLADALRALSNDGFIVTPEGTSIELLESKLTGSITTHQALCEYMDDWIAEVLLGQAPRGKAGGALAAASKEREDVRLELSQADSDLLNETLNATLLPWLCELNGFEPCQVSRVIKSEEDKQTMAETDSKVAGMGFRMTLEGVRERYGEHWELAPAAPPAPAGDKRPGQPGFAEPGSTETQDRVTQMLADLGAPIIEEWVSRLAALVDANAEPGALQRALVDAYGNLPSEQLVEVMALAFELADLRGRDAVLQEQTLA